MLPNNVPLFPFSLYRALLAEHLTFPQDVEPDVSARGLGWSQGPGWGRDADIAAVFYRCLVALLEGGKLCCVLCHVLGGLNDPNLPPGALTGSPSWME